MQFNLAIADLLDWIRRRLFAKQRRSRLPYERLATWGGKPHQQGYLHLVVRQPREGEPQAIATFLFRRKRFNGYARTSYPLDVYLELKRSKLPGHSHTVIIVAAESKTTPQGFQALPLHYGEYRWFAEDAPRSTARRSQMVKKLAEQDIRINQWEYRDRPAVCVLFAVALGLLLREPADWRVAIAQEERYILTGDRMADSRP